MVYKMIFSMCVGHAIVLYYEVGYFFVIFVDDYDDCVKRFLDVMVIITT